MSGYVDVITGLQYGSEGKGKIAALLASDYDILIRTGAPNAGHSVWIDEHRFVFQCIPAGSIINRHAKLMIGAGAVIDVEALRREIEWLEAHDMWYEGRLVIDHQAIMIQDRHIKEEWGGLAPCSHTEDPESCDLGGDCHECDQTDKSDLWRSIGSTRHGCGAAQVERIWRRGQAVLASMCGELRSMADSKHIIITGSSEWVNELIDDGARVQLEGTQGALLSIFHGHYPYTTSRDTSAAAWLSEAGISPLLVRDIIGVMRRYPIRVAGNSGPTGGIELSWEQVENKAGAPQGSLIERTSVTNRQRRVFDISTDDLCRVFAINRPTQIALTFADHINYADRGKQNWNELSDKTKDFVTSLNFNMGFNVPVRLLSTGPAQRDTVWVSQDMVKSHLRRIP